MPMVVHGYLHLVAESRLQTSTGQRSFAACYEATCSALQQLVNKQIQADSAGD